MCRRRAGVRDCQQRHDASHVRLSDAASCLRLNEIT